MFYFDVFWFEDGELSLNRRKRAWRVVLDAGFLRVCPIQPHFLRRICLATGSCPARSHSSSFRIFSGHRMLKMRLRQVAKKAAALVSSWPAILFLKAKGDFDFAVYVVALVI
nr:hypothetical protein BaRGS_032822 [Batillaria attramentaria]